MNSDAPLVRPESPPSSCTCEGLPEPGMCDHCAQERMSAAYKLYNEILGVEAERQSHRDKALAALLDARALLAPDRDMPKALRAEVRNLLDVVIRHWGEAMRRLPCD